MPKNTEKAIIDKIKHIETFYEKPPPGTVKEYEEKPEDCIPDTEANRKAREFLANAPSKGLWMPLGKEVKVMQCWKCKNYGHRTGDKECPLFTSGNAAIEKFREMYEDPMYSVLNSETRQKQDNKLRWLQQILDETTSESDSSNAGKAKAKSSKKKKKKKEKWVEKNFESDSSGNEKKVKKHKNKKQKSSKKEFDKHSRKDERSHKSRKRKDSSDYEMKHKKRKKHKK